MMGLNFLLVALSNASVNNCDLPKRCTFPILLKRQPSALRMLSNALHSIHTVCMYVYALIYYAVLFKLTVVAHIISCTHF